MRWTWYGVLGAIALVLTFLAADAQPKKPLPGQLGVPPRSGWNCLTTHPIKGNFTTYSGEPCIYHVPGGEYYDKTKPERCYATEEEARRDGCRRSRL